MGALVAEHGLAVDPAHQAAADQDGHLRRKHKYRRPDT